MPTTLVHAFLPAACLAVCANALPSLTRREWLRLLFAAMILGNLPDLDLLPVLFHSPWLKYFHRNVGHNVFALAGWICLGQWALRRWVLPTATPRQRWTIAAVLVLSHVVLDSMSRVPDDPEGRAGGVPLLYPLSDWQWRFPWRIFPGFKGDESRFHPVIAQAVSTEYWGRVIFTELRNTAILFAVWTTLWLGGRGLARLARRLTPPAGGEGPITPESVPSRRQSNART